MGHSFEVCLFKSILGIPAQAVPGVSPVACVAGSALGKWQKLDKNKLLGL
jgi:hypothetical protein